MKTNLFSMVKRQSGCGTRRARRMQPSLDQLDGRQLLAAGITATMSPLVGLQGDVTITGTSGSDAIDVCNVDNQVKVFNAADHSLIASFDRWKVRTITVNSRAGDDTIRIESSVNSITKVNDGAGHDLVSVLDASFFAPYLYHGPNMPQPPVGTVPPGEGGTIIVQDPPSFWDVI